jgi:hypothetical protein
VPSKFSMKKAPAMRVVTYSGEGVFFIALVYEKMECPVSFVPVKMRQIGIRGADYSEGKKHTLSRW